MSVWPHQQHHRLRVGTPAEGGIDDDKRLLFKRAVSDMAQLHDWMIRCTGTELGSPKGVPRTRKT
jgi:hypothetical protein